MTMLKLLLEQQPRRLHVPLLAGEHERRHAVLVTPLPKPVETIAAAPWAGKRPSQPQQSAAAKELAKISSSI